MLRPYEAGMTISEGTTRKRLIDQALRGAGWAPIVPFNDGASRDLVVFEEYPTAAINRAMAA